MPKAVYVVQSSPADPAQEPLFNEWYSATHIPEVLAVPGFVSARRFKVAGDSDGKPAYLAIYEIEADDVAAPVAELTRRLMSGEMTLLRELRFDRAPVTALYEQLP